MKCRPRLAACQKGLSVGFTTAAAPVCELMEARDEKHLLRFQKQLAKYRLLIIDELGFVPLSKTGAEFLFEVFSQRYERGSILVTSNPRRQRLRHNTALELNTPTAARTKRNLWHRLCPLNLSGHFGPQPSKRSQIKTDRNRWPSPEGYSECAEAYAEIRRTSLPHDSVVIPWARREI